MNYTESLARLEQEKKRLEEEESSTVDTKKKLLIGRLIEGYSKVCEEEVDSQKTEEIFSKVAGFAQEKEEIKRILATQKYHRAMNIKSGEPGKVLCFVGPPGVGKTHFASHLAQALGRKFFQISLGGTSAAVALTGGEGIWLGAEPGKIIMAMVETKSCNPVILIDEVEKTGKDDRHGRIEDALLHIFDPEQKTRFTDHYLNIPIDISQITFVLTANELEKIPEPLKDRLQIKELKGYNESEKLQIGKITIERIFSEVHQDKNKDLFEMKEEALKALIKKTDEKGVRQLKQKIENVINWSFGEWVRQLEKGEEESKIIIDEKKVNEIIPEGDPEKEASEEDKLRQRIEELEREKEDLQSQPSLLFESFALSKDKEFCDKHQKNTCQTTRETCALCTLEEQFKQLNALIGKENSKNWGKIWTKQKSAWESQASNLQNGSPEEQELALKIKQGISQVSAKIASQQSSQSNKGWSGYLWMIGGGVFLTLLGIAGGYFLVQYLQKKKKKQSVFSRNFNS